jgi:outer membrane protein TolC
MKNIILFFAFFFAHGGYANEISFGELWTKIKNESPSISRESHNYNAADLAVGRAEKHWLPSLTLSASSFSTNDPGANFIGDLSQRQITSLDFTPSTLNNPGFNNFEVGSLGLVFPIYEGGSKQSELLALTKMRDADSLNKKEVTLSEYVESAFNYAMLMTITSAKLRLETLLVRVSEVLSRYSIGSHSNPVGYSGMLGLKSLKMRVQGELLNIQSKEESTREVLTQKAKLENNTWKIKTEDTLTFLDRELSPSNNQTASLRESILRARADSMEEMKEGEKSRYRPKVGLFANENMIHGDRSTGTNFTVGVYLSWALFSPDNLARVSEKEELRRAAVSNADFVKQSSEIGKNALIQSEVSMRKNLVLLLESEKLLTEQVKVTGKLFQSGSISALQLAEVLNRRVDLILSILELENNLIDVRSKRVMLTQVSGVNL